MSADESKPPSQAKGEIVAKPEPSEQKPEAGPAETRAAESKPAESKPAESKPAESKPAESRPAEKAAPSWVKQDPFPPRKDPPPAEPTAAAAARVVERAAPAPRPEPTEKVVVDPALRTTTAERPPPSSRPAPPEPPRPTPAEPRRVGAQEPVASEDLLAPAHRFLGLPIWGWLLAGVAVLGLLFLLADLRNRNRFTIVCNAHKVELHQGRRFPWPFGLEPIGGPEYAPVAIPAEADCRKRSFGSEEEAAKAFLDLILAQVRGALANPGASNLKQARAQLAQAMLLTRTYRARRKEAKGMLADLSYREGRASLARAENELRIALARFQEAQKLESSRFEDLDDWISHLESLLRTISPSPFSGGGGVLSTPPPAAGSRLPPSSQPRLPPPPAGDDRNRLPPPPSDAGPPTTGGGILM
jgi:hypothetical protein